MRKKTYSLPRRAEPTCIAKLPPTLGKGVGRRSPWESLGKERKPSAKGVTPSVKGVAIRKWAYDLGKKGATPAEKGAIQRAEGHRSTAGVDGTLPGLHGTWQTKSTKPPSKVTLSCPTAPLLEMNSDLRRTSGGSNDDGPNPLQKCGALCASHLSPRTRSSAASCPCPKGK